MTNCTIACYNRIKQDYFGKIIYIYFSLNYSKTEILRLKCCRWGYKREKVTLFNRKSRWILIILSFLKRFDGFAYAKVQEHKVKKRKRSPL